MRRTSRRDAASTPTGRTCRHCGVAVGATEDEAVRRRLRAQFPGMSERWSYCAGCMPLVEDLLACAGRPETPRPPGPR